MYDQEPLGRPLEVSPGEGWLPVYIGSSRFSASAGRRIMDVVTSRLCMNCMSRVCALACTAGCCGGVLRPNTSIRHWRSRNNHSLLHPFLLLFSVSYSASLSLCHLDDTNSLVFQLSGKGASGQLAVFPYHYGGMLVVCMFTQFASGPYWLKRLL